MKRKLTGSASAAIALFVASGLLASLLGVRQYERITTAPSWVTTAALKAGQILSPDMLVHERVDKDLLSGTIQNPDIVIGKKLRVDKAAGQLIAPNDFEQIKRKPLSDAIPQGRVLYTLRKPQISVPVAQLNQGDRFDVVVRGRGKVRTVARSAQLIGLVNGGQNEAAKDSDSLKSLLQPGGSKNDKSNATNAALVLAVRPVDVFPLASIGEAEIVSLVLHSAQDIALGKPHHVGPYVSKFHEVEMVSGLKRSKVRLNP